MTDTQTRGTGDGGKAGRLDTAALDRAHSALSVALSKAKEEPKRLRLPAFVRGVAVLEIALFLGIAIALDAFLLRGDRFLSIEPHPFWVIVIIAAVQYGTNAGLVAALASSAALLAWNLPQQGVMQDFYDYIFTMALKPALWLGAALVVGELSNRERERAARLAGANADMAEQIKVIDDAYQRVLRAKEGLEARVAGQLRTVVNLYQAARRLEQMSPEQVVSGASDMVRAVLSPRRFSLWRLDGGILEAALTEGWRDADGFSRRFDSGSALFRAIVAERRFLSVASRNDEAVLGGEGVMAGPLIAPATGEVIGLIKIEEIGFLEMNQAAIENLKVLCEWISAALERAMKVEKIAEGSLYNVESTLFSSTFLERQTAFLLRLAERTNFDVCKLVVRVDGADSVAAERQPSISAAVGKAVADMLRDTDMAFDQQRTGWEFVVLLPATTPEGADLVGQKLRENVEARLKSEHLSLRAVVTNHVLYRAKARPAGSADA